MAKRQNYLNNKELLKEIHKSKVSYSSFIRPEYADYDGICQSQEEITPEFIEKVKDDKAKKETREKKQELRDEGVKAPKFTVEPQEIDTDGLIIRVMEHDHVPYDENRKKRAKKPLDEKVKCVFPPFKHYYVNSDLSIEEVGRSHWQGSLSNGYFSQEHGQMTDRLAGMCMQLVERYGQRGNWRGYCVDEKTKALTKRGWLGLDEIDLTDEIMSYSEGELVWSPIYDIYKDTYEGPVHVIESTEPHNLQPINMMFTPGHKLVTGRGLVKFEDLEPTDEITLFPGWVVPVSELLEYYGMTGYEGRIWCPKTEYGSFVAKRENSVHITGNTYLDEMKSQALFQLAQIALQFDESRSETPNPFAYYSSACANSFTRVLNLEKKNQNIRDDILEMNDMTPSFTRQYDNTEQNKNED